MTPATAQEMLGRMLGKKLYVVLWHLRAGADLGPVLRSHLEYMIDLERRGLLFASGPLGRERASAPTARWAICGRAFGEL